MTARKKLCSLLPSVLAILVLISTPLASKAEEAEKAWQPEPPMPDDFDWIQLTSGEWLKGEIIAMYDESLEFDSDELDALTLDWDDIQQVRSAQTMQVAFLDDIIVTGKLLVDGDTVRVMGEDDYETTRSQVLSVTAGAPKESNYWSGKLSVGLNIRSGNTDQTDYNAQANFKRRTPKNRIRIDYLGNFSETDETTTADSQRATADWNRFISDRFYLTPVYGEYFRDPFQNIAGRWSIGVGAGYQIVDTSKVEWSVDAGLGYQRTQFEEVLEGDPDTEDSPALGIGTRYDNELTGWMDYFFGYNFAIINEESGSYTHHIITGFEFEFFGDFDFDVSLVWDRIQDPQRKADGTLPEQDDFKMIFALGYSF